MNIREAAAGLRARRFSAVELATAALARIERHQASLRAFITVTASQALDQARTAISPPALTAGRFKAFRSR
jgi:aspartyl-tRNA(Asn)/glutamyl-tRNA(Gln) amidotransferase subunit A